MKRSKIFLGVTTALLAVAGVTAAKHYIPGTTRLYLTFNKTACLETTGITCSQGGTTRCVSTLITSGNHSVPLFTDGPAGRYTSTNTACKTPLKYTNEQ